MCFSDGYPDDPAEFSDFSTRVARKQHQCCDCDTPIMPGQKHYVLKTLFDGRWDTSRRCQRCETVANALERAAYRRLKSAQTKEPWVSTDYHRVPWGELQCCLREWKEGDL